MQIDVVRAWKDEEYRQSLMAAGYEIPENPAGAVELSEEDLAKVAGGLPKTTRYPAGYGHVDCSNQSALPAVCGAVIDPHKYWL